MNSRKPVCTRRPLIAAALSLLISGWTSISSAQNWELRVADTNVPGTSEIESGKIDKAIRISEAHLPHAMREQKVAVLTNLCIAYIHQANFIRATDYCNRATQQSNERSVSFNNRAMLKVVKGDLAGAAEDLTIAISAGCLGKCSEPKNVPDNLPRMVARRNLQHVETLVTAMAATSESDQPGIE